MAQIIKLFQAQNHDDSIKANEMLLKLKEKNPEIEISYIPPGPEVCLNYPYIELPDGIQRFGLTSIQEYVDAQLFQISGKVSEKSKRVELLLDDSDKVAIERAMDIMCGLPKVIKVDPYPATTRNHEPVAWWNDQKYRGIDQIHDLACKLHRIYG